MVSNWNPVSFVKYPGTLIDKTILWSTDYVMKNSIIPKPR